MKPSKQCKEAGLSSLKELESIVKVKERTLINWHKNNPIGFEALLLGAVVIKSRSNGEMMVTETGELMECRATQVLNNAVDHINHENYNDALSSISEAKEMLVKLQRV